MKRTKRKGPLRLSDLARKVKGRRGEEVLSFRQIVGRSPAIVEVSETEHLDEEMPPLQGRFAIVMIIWADITVTFVDGESDRQELSGVPPAGESGLLRFMQVGIKVRDDEHEVVLVHSFSLQPNRSEFFTFPKGVIEQEVVLAHVQIDGHRIEMVESVA